MTKGKKQGLLLVLAVSLILLGIFQKDFGKWGNELLSNIFPPHGKNINSETEGPENTKLLNNDETDDPMSSETPEPTPTDIPVGAEPIKTDETGKAEYFSKEKIERDASRARTKEQYEKITMDENATLDVKTNAYNSIMELTRMAEAEKKIEMMIEERGYEDCFACFSESGDIDVIIKTDKLESSEVVILADIISRHGNISLDKVHIRSVD